MKNLRLNLLSNIIGITGVNPFKYSTAFNSLNAVIELEKKETKNKLPESIFKEFEDIKNRENNLNDDLKGIPLLILEQYFVRNSNNLDKYIYIQYNTINKELRVIELYLVLERYFEKMFILASKIADYYNLEIKIKTDTKEKDIMI